MFGTVESDQLLSLLQKSKVLVSTSLYEGFGLSLIEALACGHHCIAFDVCAVREVLEPIDNQLTVQPRDVLALVQHATTFLSLNPKELQKKADEYRSAVIDQYSLEKSAQSLHRVYQQLSSS